MVATIGQMASAEYYLESQRSFRHPNEYYTAGEEPDGTRFNTKSLLGLNASAQGLPFGAFVEPVSEVFRVGVRG